MNNFYKDIVEYICYNRDSSVLLCGCSLKLMSKLSEDLRSKNFMCGDKEAGLGIVFGFSCNVESVENSLTKLSSYVNDVLVYFYMGDCEQGLGGKTSDYWMNFIKELYGKSVFRGIIGRGFIISTKGQ